MDAHAPPIQVETASKSFRRCRKKKKMMKKRAELSLGLRGAFKAREDAQVDLEHARIPIVGQVFTESQDTKKFKWNSRKRGSIDITGRDDDDNDDDNRTMGLEYSASATVPARACKKKAKHRIAKVPTADHVLKMGSEDLHNFFPFTAGLKFDERLIWSDPDHRKLTKACQKAGRNLFGHSIIVGRNPKKKGKLNFWATGTKDEIIVPYNLKLKLRMAIKGRPNHQCDEREKARVAAMYRECELRGLSFRKPPKA
eukprot:g215.t1